ncbi:MAG: histidine triad nucleotide-binding protein [Chthoniobacteraceae bacterium]
MTVFEKIAAGQIPAKFVLENEDFVAFHDVNAQAPVHVLIVPRKCITRLSETDGASADLLGRMLLATREIAQKLGVLESGYRVVINNGRDAGESVPHLHIHFLAGRALAWPPG